VSGSGVISGEQLDVLAAYEQLFWTHGAVPTEERVAELTGVRLETVKKYWQDDEFRQRLQKRGLPLDGGRSEQLLTVQQLDVANRMLNLADNRSKREKLQECGVSPQQYSAWLRQPAFQQYMARRGEELFKSADGDAYRALVGIVEAGDVQGLKLFFEMRGIYNPRMQVDINVDAVMLQVVEVISRHVRDPETLIAIAEDLERLDILPSGGAGQISRSSHATAIPVASTQVSGQFSI